MTQYIIKTIKHPRGYRLFLKFKDKNKWRFIPSKEKACVIPKFLNKKKLPTKDISVSYYNIDTFINCQFGEEQKLYNFIHQYNNIDDYFNELKEERNDKLSLKTMIKINKEDEDNFFTPSSLFDIDY